MKSNMFWYTIFMSIQRLCYLGGGGVPSLKTSQGLGYRGKRKSIHLRVTEEQRAQLILREREHWGTGKICGTRERVPSSLPGRASSVVCKVLISA